MCEPGLTGLTSRQARFVSGPQIRTLPNSNQDTLLHAIALVLGLGNWSGCASSRFKAGKGRNLSPLAAARERPRRVPAVHSVP